MEEFRIGRATASESRLVTVSNGASVLIAAADPKRIALAVSKGATGTVLLGPQGVTLAAGRGASLTDGSPTIMMTLETHGRMVQQQWNAWGDGAANAVLVTTSTLERE